MRALRAYSVLARHAASPPPPPTSHAYALLGPELGHVRSSLLGLLRSGHPGLSSVAGCCFGEGTPQLRSLVVLLFARATNGVGGSWGAKERAAAVEAGSERDTTLTHADVLHNSHPSMPSHTASFSAVFDLRPAGLCTPRPGRRRLLPTQLRLAQIVEMIHTASVLHERTTDAFPNKLSILAGDFLLGRASTALSRLGEAEVVELIASVISNQAEGEMLRGHGLGSDTDPWPAYLRRTYLKTASLMAKGARASVVLGGCSEPIWKDAAYSYGRNLGIAYQLGQDSLEHGAGAPITSPVLFAAEEHPDLHPLIRRNLAGEGDVQKAKDYVARSQGTQRTRALAASYADKAREALQPLPESEYKEALDVLAKCAATTAL